MNIFEKHVSILDWFAQHPGLPMFKIKAKLRDSLLQLNNNENTDDPDYELITNLLQEPKEVIMATVYQNTANSDEGENAITLPGTNKEIATQRVNIPAPKADIAVPGNRKAAAIWDQLMGEMNLTPEEQLNQMADYLEMAVNPHNKFHLFMFLGAPGLGKTYRVKQALKSHGLNEGVEYEFLNGNASESILYNKMFHCRKPGQLLILDDADTLLKDKTILTYIKNATDTSLRRVSRAKGASKNMVLEPEIAEEYNETEPLAQTRDGEAKYVTMGKDSFYTVPLKFDFNGVIIILSNSNVDSFEPAIINRANLLDFRFSGAQKMELVEKVSAHFKAKDYSCSDSELADAISTSLQVLKKVTKAFDGDLPGDGVSLRNLVQMINIYLSCTNVSKTKEMMLTYLKNQLAPLQKQK